MNFVQVYPKIFLSYSDRTELFETFNDGVLSKGLNFRLKLLNEFVFCSFFCECFQVPMKEGSSCVIICIHNNNCRHLNHVFKCKNLEFLSSSIKFEILLLDYLLQRALFFFFFLVYSLASTGSHKHNIIASSMIKYIVIV